MHRATLKDQQRARIALGMRLRARRSELEPLLLSRLRETADLTTIRDAEYLHGLQMASAAALEYMIECLASISGTAPPVPLVLSTQARLAARCRIPLEDVLRRYFAGYHLLADVISAEAQKEETFVPGHELQRLLQIASVRFDRLIAQLSDDYRIEAERQPTTSQDRLVDRIARMLAGEPLAATDLAYDFDGWHIGCVAAGPNAGTTILQLAKAVDCSTLLVPNSEGLLWAWLGGRKRLDCDWVRSTAVSVWPREARLAIGEAARKKDGWRLSHRQAVRAFPLASQTGAGIVRYADVALLSSAVQDDLLSTSLREMYLARLEETRDGGAVAAETLRAYFECDQVISATAEVLRVHRRTVTNRLRAIEVALGKPITLCRAELATALQLAQMVE